jgi:hypothetical protein
MPLYPPPGPYSNAEPLAGGGEAIFRRLDTNVTLGMASGTLALSYWTAVTSGAATTATTATIGTAASGLTYAAVGVYSVAGNGNLTLLGSSGDLHASMWIGTYASYPAAVAFTRVAGVRYAFGALAVGSTPPYLAAAGANFAFNDQAPIVFGNVPAQATLPNSIAAGSIGIYSASGPAAYVTP